jgi:hypothetical protein
MNHTLEEKKIIWVIGSLERLAGLGYFNEIGYRVDLDVVDLYWELDDIRDYLFDNEEEMFNILLCVLDESGMDFDEIKEIHKLILSYKNDRSKVFSFAMKNFSLV